MGGVSSQPLVSVPSFGGTPSATPKVAPSDGYFLSLAARAGDLQVIRLFLNKNPALVGHAASYFAPTHTGWAWRVLG
jgi:hypothetical protein